MRTSQRLVLRFAITAAIAGSPAAASHAAGARGLTEAACPIPGDLNSDGTFDLASGLRSTGTLLAGTDVRRWPDGRLFYPGGIVNTGRTSVPVDLVAGGQFVVDPGGRLVYAVDDGLGHITTWFFAAASLRKTDPSGAVTTYVYGSNGRIRSVEDPLGHITRYGYDANGNLERVIDANSAVTSYRYTGRRVVSSTAPDGGTTSYTYDHAGRLVGVTSQGNVVTYEYGGDDLWSASRTRPGQRGSRTTSPAASPRPAIPTARSPGTRTMPPIESPPRRGRTARRPGTPTMP